MRYAKTRKAETRTRVIETAARALRRDGIDGIGVVGLMGEAGLTKGGFYAHFESKDGLVAEAVAMSLHASAERMRGLAQDGRSPLDAIVDGYLSAEHAAKPEAGCTVGALLSDLTRADGAVRKSAAGGAAELASAIEEALPGTIEIGRRPKAQAILGLLAGSLQLARLEADPADRDAILAAARDAVRHLTVSPNE